MAVSMTWDSFLRGVPITRTLLFGVYIWGAVLFWKLPSRHMKQLQQGLARFTTNFTFGKG